MIETHRIAKVLPSGPFAVAHPKDGWIDGSGKTIAISASPKKTRFFAAEADAKGHGFSPSELQSKVLAESKPKPKEEPKK